MRFLMDWIDQSNTKEKLCKKKTKKKPAGKEESWKIYIEEIIYIIIYSIYRIYSI